MISFDHQSTSNDTNDDFVFTYNAPTVAAALAGNILTLTVSTVSSAPSTLEAVQAGGSNDGNSLSLPSNLTFTETTQGVWTATFDVGDMNAPSDATGIKFTLMMEIRNNE